MDSPNIAYCSDALLRAAWIEGHLGAIANEPRWWHREDPGMGMKHSAVEIRCTFAGLDLVLPADDAETTAAALRAIQQFPRVLENRVLIDQDRTGDPTQRPIDTEDRVQLCIRLVRALHEVGL